MATKNPQRAFYAWVVVSDWIAEQLTLWDLSSVSKLLNHVLMLWILMERHGLLHSTLEKLALLEGFRSVDELKKSLSSRFGRDEE
jgi:hypothetical protein